MTPVQLPEVPAIARFNVTGDYCYPTVDDPEGSCVSYDDHAAQLREYATQAVMAERARIAAAIEVIAKEMRERLVARKFKSMTLEAWAARLTAVTTPSETNSG